MPLIQEGVYSSKQACRWFGGEDCEKGGVLGAVETGWNLRHAALASVGMSKWTSPHKTENKWAFAKDVPLEKACLLDTTYFYRATAIDRKALTLRVEFDALSKKWERDTKHLSLVSKKIIHPAYLRIIGMGRVAIPLLLEALRDRPAHWFPALRAIANHDPANVDDNPSQARVAWLRWGKAEGLID